MSTTTELSSPRLPPKLVVSQPTQQVLGSSRRTVPTARKRSKTESLSQKGTEQECATEWIDIDDKTRSKRRRPARRPNARLAGQSFSPRHCNTESEVGRFFPRLSRILESTDSRSTSRPGTSGSDAKADHERADTPRRHRRHRNDVPITSHRSARHRTGGVSRRSEAPYKINPSLLSVLSSLTRASDKSSSSSTTITQRSYDRRNRASSSMAEDQSSVTENHSHKSRTPTANVFDFMEMSANDDHDRHSVHSSSSSHHGHSDAGSSELPDTPSSRSTFPSPTTTRTPSLAGSVAELRRKYDPQCLSSTVSHTLERSDSRSPPSSVPRLRKSSKASTSAREEECRAEPRYHHAGSNEGQEHSSSASPQLSRHPPHVPAESSWSQGDATYQHQAQSHQGQHFIEPVYGQHRSHSASSHRSATSTNAYAQQHYMAMQQYHYPTHPAAVPYAMPSPAMNAHVERPPAPDAPDLSQRTLAGYEQLAMELADAGSGVKPLYRKFEYLNHRILLHLQDELSELEEQLRTCDEIIAQIEPTPVDAPRRPASRREDAFSTLEIHHRRTALLGRIFLKTEQYNKAMSSFAAMNKASQPAPPQQVEVYREWLQTKTPIHEVETRFLQHRGDLVDPMAQQPQKQSCDAPNRPTKHVGLTCLPVALMLPLLLFAIVPSFMGRLVVTGLLAAGAFMVATKTRVQHLMPTEEWAVCGAAYVLWLTAIAGCMTKHSS